MHPLAVAVVASMLASSGPDPHAGIQRDYLIKAFVNWGAPLIKGGPPGTGDTAEGLLLLAYAANVYGAHEDIPALFPPSHLGGTPAEWGARSRDGLRITFDRPHTWEAVRLDLEPDVLEPPELLALWHGGLPATVSEVRYREDQLLVQGGGICLWPPFPSGCTTYDSGWLALVDLDFVDLDTIWTATVTVELYCVYKDAEGRVTGVLASADVGLPTDTASMTLDFIPVPAGESSWGTLKAKFAGD